MTTAILSINLLCSESGAMAFYVHSSGNGQKSAYFKRQIIHQWRTNKSTGLTNAASQRELLRQSIAYFDPIPIASAATQEHTTQYSAAVSHTEA